MTNYFICTYGEFPERDEIIRKSIDNKIYLLHEAARYPSAINKIEKDDIILLKNFSYIIAWGKAKGKLETISDSGWRYAVNVEKWHSFDINNLHAGFYTYGVSYHTIIGGQMSVVKQVEEDWAKQQLSNFSEVSQDDNLNSFISAKHSGEDENINTVTCYRAVLQELLYKNLHVPPYQRGYCWRKENIIKFLESINQGLQKHNLNDEIANNTKNDTETPDYHLGTIILKHNEEDNGQENKIDRFNLIDGQQRLTTLSILLYCLDNKVELSILEQDITGTENNSEEHIGYIVRAQKTIKEWLGNNMISKEALLNHVVLTLITIPKNESEDLAYRFFNATNGTGKRLSDYDLLKNHHLRHVPNSQAGFVASKWNNMKEEEHDRLLDKILYRLRNWSYRNTFDIKPTNDGKRLLFEHYSVQYDPIKNMYCVPLHPQYNSIFSGGLDFFSFVENHKVHYKSFCDLKPVKRLSELLSRHSKGTLFEGIKAISFLYYLKYGELYFSEALFCIAYRLSELRNKKRVYQSYLSSENVFRDLVRMIDVSTTANVFFAYCLSPQFQYVRDRGNPSKESYTKVSYWGSLDILLKELHQQADFAMKQQCKSFIGEIKNV